MFVSGKVMFDDLVPILHGILLVKPNFFVDQILRCLLMLSPGECGCRPEICDAGVVSSYPRKKMEKVQLIFNGDDNGMIIDDNGILIGMIMDYWDDNVNGIISNYL